MTCANRERDTNYQDNTLAYLTNQSVEPGFQGVQRRKAVHSSQMTGEPPTLGANGRALSGRFAKGNKLGQGNPLAGQAARIRAVLLTKVTPEVTAAIADRLIEQAKDGDLAAVRELLDRTIGKPGQTEMLERLERLEQLLEASQAKEVNNEPTTTT